MSACRSHVVRTAMALALAASIVPGAWGTASGDVRVKAGPKIQLGFADPAYAFAASCDLAQPLVTVSARAQNTGAVPLSEVSLGAVSDTGVLEGTQTLPALGPGETFDFKIALRHVAASAAPIAGSHVVSFVARGRALATLILVVPPDFCEGIALGSPADGPVGAHAKTRPKTEESASNVNPARDSLIIARSKGRSQFTVTAPSNMQMVDPGSCANVDFGPCFYINRRAAVVFGWDWQARGGADENVAGFRVYRVDGGRKELVDSTFEHALVLQHLRAAEIAGRCYAVSAYVDKGPESGPSATACVPADWKPKFEY